MSQGRGLGGQTRSYGGTLPPTAPHPLLRVALSLPLKGSGHLSASPSPPREVPPRVMPCAAARSLPDWRRLPWGRGFLGAVLPGLWFWDWRGPGGQAQSCVTSLPLTVTPVWDPGPGAEGPWPSGWAGLGCPPEAPALPGGRWSLQRACGRQEGRRPQDRRQTWHHPISEVTSPLSSSHWKPETSSRATQGRGHRDSNNWESLAAGGASLSP